MVSMDPTRLGRDIWDATSLKLICIINQKDGKNG